VAQLIGWLNLVIEKKSRSKLMRQHLRIYSNLDIVAKTPPLKSGGISPSTSTPTGNHATPASVNVSALNLSSAPAAAVLPGSNSVRNVLENAIVNQSASTKEEEINSFPGRRPSPSLSDVTLARGRNSLSNQGTASNPLGSGNMVSSNGVPGSVPSASEITKRNILGADDRLGSSGMVLPLVSPLSNRLILPQVGKANDGPTSVDSGTVSEAAAVSGRVFSPSGVPGMQWRPGSPFQNQNDAVKFLSLNFLFLLFICPLYWLQVVYAARK
jgi:CCR4-NOT transcription complex subunit 3